MANGNAENDFEGHSFRNEVEDHLVKKKRPVRVYMDGCFDVMHFGHANALRQAATLGDELVVGVCSDAEITKHKGPPVMSDEERIAAVSEIKWVHEVIPRVPYVLTDSFLNDLLHKYKIDLIAHGDDPCVGADGRDAYESVKKAGRFRTVKRTEGVSSTDVVSRILCCTQDNRRDSDNDLYKNGSYCYQNGTHNNVDYSSIAEGNVQNSSPIAKTARKASNGRPHYGTSQFLLTSRRLAQFTGTVRSPKASDRVVYIDGSFDLLHAGHVAALRKARSLGDFLIVGIHNDETVHERKGRNMPIMSVHERSLMVLACKCVDEVIIGAPWEVTRDMITSLNISIVVHGRYHKDGLRLKQFGCIDLVDPYSVPRELGILGLVDSASDISVEQILRRVADNRDAYIKRNEKKEKGQLEYITKHKKFVEEV